MAHNLVCDDAPYEADLIAEHLTKLAAAEAELGVWRQEFVRAQHKVDFLRAERAELVSALEMIAGERQCVDNLMSNSDIARAALDRLKTAKD